MPPHSYGSAAMTLDTEQSKITTREGIEVQVGQVWRDLDKRSRGRTVEITAVDAKKGIAHYKAGRAGKIAIARMHKTSTGFELVR